MRTTMYALVGASLAAVLALPAIIAGGMVMPGVFHAVFPHPMARPDANPRSALGLAYEDVVFAASGGAAPRTLRGWFVPAPQLPDARPLGVVLVHGAGRGRDQLLPYLPFLRGGANASVLVLECRTGAISYGYGEHEDVLGAAEYLRQRLGPASRIVVLGTSAGGAATIRAAAADPEERAIDAIITVGAFATLDGVLADVPPDVWNRIVPFVGSGGGAAVVRAAGSLLLRAARPLVGLAVGERVGSNAPVDEIARVTHPHLIAHGTHDGLVHVDHARELHANARQPAELHEIHHGSHNAVHLLNIGHRFRDKMMGILRPKGRA